MADESSSRPRGVDNASEVISSEAFISSTTNTSSDENNPFSLTPALVARLNKATTDDALYTTFSHVQRRMIL